VWGFTYNWKHSYNDFGIIIGKFNIPIVGDLKEYRQSIPGIQGTVLLQNDDLQDRMVELTECYIQIDPTTADRNNPIQALQQKVRAIAAWLNPRNSPSYITFDDDTGLSYLGIISDKLDTSVLGIARKFTIKFRCDPFLYSSLPASAWNNAQYASGLPYDSGSEYNQPSTVVTVNGTGTFSMWNGGTATAYPVVTITPVTPGATFSAITITNTTTGESLAWSGSASTSLVIDTKNMVIYTTSGASQVNQFAYTSGVFFSLGAGETNNFSVTVTGDIQLSFDYRFPFY